MFFFASRRRHTRCALVTGVQTCALPIAAGADKITLPLSVSETHSLANLRRTHDQVIDEAAAIARMIREQPPARRPHFEGSLSTAFGCTLEVPIPDAQLARLAAAMLDAGCDEVGLSGTTGYSDPVEVQREKGPAARKGGGEGKRGARRGDMG